MRQAVNPPAELRSKAGPYSANSEALWPIVGPSVARDAAVGYSES
jgi:hypothetical protein